MADYTINAADTLPVLLAWPLDPSGQKIRLGTSAGQIPPLSTAAVICRNISGTETTYAGTVQDDGAGNAQVRVAFTPARPEPGEYRFRIRVTYPNGADAQSFPNGDVPALPTMMVSKA